MSWPILIAKFLFLIVCVVFGIFSLILVYHWHRYGRGMARAWIFELVYLAVGAILVLTSWGFLQNL